MIAFVAAEAALLGDVGFAADDRFQALGRGGAIKLDRREEVSVVGNRHRRHSQLNRPVHQDRNLAGAVQETVIGVQVQMNELLPRHGRMIA